MEKHRDRSSHVKSKWEAAPRIVLAAYGGRCAMCGLNFELPIAARICSAAALSSANEIENSLCLCPNHHLAFEMHLIWVNPDTKEIKVHPDLRKGVTAGDRAVVDSLYPVLQLPADPAAHPRPEMFRQRYEQPDFQGKYDWV